MKYTASTMRIRTTALYRDWINSLKDRAARARIQVRVDSLVHGNPGQHRNLASGISELKIDVGPGYRVYYTQRGDELIILLVGGDKSLTISAASPVRSETLHAPRGWPKLPKRRD